MKKLPAIQFYFGDWKKDTNLAMCSLSTRGFWHELLGAMHELGRSGQITGTAQQLARVCRCTAAEAEDAIAELKQTRTADVFERAGIYTLINRRMKREFEENKKDKSIINKRPSIPPSVRKRVLSVGQCEYCGADENLTVDHIYPLSKGGAHSEENFQCLCWSCNRAKYDYTEDEYFRRLNNE